MAAGIECLYVNSSCRPFRRNKSISTMKNARFSDKQTLNSETPDLNDNFAQPGGPAPLKQRKN